MEQVTTHQINTFIELEKALHKVSEGDITKQVTIELFNYNNGESMLIFNAKPQAAELIIRAFEIRFPEQFIVGVY